MAISYHSLLILGHKKVVALLQGDGRTAKRGNSYLIDYCLKMANFHFAKVVIGKKLLIFYIFEIACISYLNSVETNRIIDGETAEKGEFPWMVFHLKHSISNKFTTKFYIQYSSSCEGCFRLCDFKIQYKFRMWRNHHLRFLCIDGSSLC